MASKRCPLCRKVSEAHAMKCGCGYTFGQEIEETFQLLDTQLHKGIRMAVTGGLIVLVGFALVIMMVVGPHEKGFIWLSLGGWIGGFTLLARGVGMSVRARTSKRELEKRRELPTAHVVER